MHPTPIAPRHEVGWLAIMGRTLLANARTLDQPFTALAGRSAGYRIAYRAIQHAPTIRAARVRLELARTRVALLYCMVDDSPKLAGALSSLNHVCELLREVDR